MENTVQEHMKSRPFIDIVSCMTLIFVKLVPYHWRRYTTFKNVKIVLRISYKQTHRLRVLL